MLYREAGQFKTSYAEDQQIFPIRQDRFAMIALLVVAFVVVPLTANQYWLSAILTPFLIFALATMGLNILTGYAGQLSLGTAAFMAVGAFAAYNFVLRVPGMPILVAFVLAGICAALVGIVFGLPSLRIKGFYLAVATLAAQFFVVWALTKFAWFSNYSTSGVISAQKMSILAPFSSRNSTMSWRPMWEAPPRALSQSPPPQSMMPLSTIGSSANSFFVISKSKWA